MNYNKLIIKKKESKLTNDEKHALVQECIDLIGSKFKELVYKHDGCRVIQQLLKNGNRVQRQLVVESIKDQYLHMMTEKYSHYLASKSYYYAPLPEQKAYFRSLVTSQINKHIQHAVSRIQCFLR